FALKLKKIKKEEVDFILQEVEKLPRKIQEILNFTDPIKDFAQDIKDARSLFYIGRGLDYYSVIEGALKLKEVSYIHSEALAAGELKHGTLALIEKDTPVVAVASQEKLMDKTFSNIEEVRARGAKVFTICGENSEKIEKISYKS